MKPKIEMIDKRLLFTPIMIEWGWYIMTSISCIFIISEFIFRSVFFARRSRQTSLLMLKSWRSTWNRSWTCGCLWLWSSGWLSFIFGYICRSKFGRIWMHWARSWTIITKIWWVNARVRGRRRSIIITDGASKPWTYARAGTSVRCTITTFQKTWSWWKRDGLNNPF